MSPRGVGPGAPRDERGRLVPRRDPARSGAPCDCDGPDCVICRSRREVEVLRQAGILPISEVLASVIDDGVPTDPPSEWVCGLCNTPAPGLRLKVGHLTGCPNAPKVETTVETAAFVAGHAAPPLPPSVGEWIESARRHGEASDPDMEVGDLIDLIYSLSTSMDAATLDAALAKHNEFHTLWDE